MMMPSLIMSGSWTVPTYFMCPNIEGFSTYEVVNAGVDLMENNASCKATCIDTVLVKIHDGVV